MFQCRECEDSRQGYVKLTSRIWKWGGGERVIDLTAHDCSWWQQKVLVWVMVMVHHPVRRRRLVVVVVVVVVVMLVEENIV